jgi:hypothetical protein
VFIACDVAVKELVDLGSCPLPFIEQPNWPDTYKSSCIMENRENATNTQLSAPEACNYPRVVPSMP